MLSDLKLKLAEIMYEDAFCVSPNAWGGVLNQDTIPRIQAQVVCGACNNQLQFASDAVLMMQVLSSSIQGMSLAPLDLFYQRGVTYVPDFVCNRMGVVNCSMEVACKCQPIECCSPHVGCAGVRQLPR